jgi:flagellin-like hook-associated protein FlgL
VTGNKQRATSDEQPAMAILPIQLARVSNLLRTSVATQNIASTQQQLLEVQNELSSGKKVNTPSDDPGQAAIIQQLQKTLESRKAYGDNLKQAGDHLGEVDSTMGDLTNLLKQAQTIASANVGSDVTADQRASAAAVVQSIYNQVLAIGNKQFEGVYLFGGDRSTTAPFVEENGGVKFIGSATVLQNQYDENSTLPFMIDGDELFGALSTRVQAADLSPSLGNATRLIDLAGGTGNGVRLGSIQIGNGSTSATIDLSGADTIGDVITRINNAAIGGITAQIGNHGLSVQLVAGAGDNIIVNEVGGGTTAADLGILTTAGGGAGVDVIGATLKPSVTALTNLGDLNGGAGIDLTGLRITNGLTSDNIDLTGAVTVEDLLNRINSSSTGVRAEINATRSGINILNPTQGTQLTIAENGGTTAADLGVRSFNPNTQLAELNDGKGVRTVNGDDITIKNTLGTSFGVDLSNLTSVQDVIDAINTAATTAGANVTASFATSGNGIVLTDSAGGAQTLTVTAANYSNAASDLGLMTPASGNVITGADVNAVSATGIFANLQKLRDALIGSDQQGITAASERLQVDHDRVTRMRGQTGARVQELESRQNRLADQNLATQSLLSSLQDTDFTEAIAKFQTLQTTLQASLQSGARMLDLSLLDFLR